MKSSAPVETLQRRWQGVRLATVFEAVFLVIVFATAVLLRVYRLSSAPTGLRPDEAFNGVDVLNILAGDRPVYLTTGNFGKEVLFIYAQALSVAVLGRTDLALRVAASAFGVATVLMTHVLSRRLFSARVSLLTTAWLSISLWHVVFSRIGLRTISLPFFTVSLMYCLWRGFQAVDRERLCPMSHWPRTCWFAASGLFLGLSLYTYTAARILPVVVLAFIIYLWFGNSDLLRRSVSGLAVAAAISGAVVLPEAIFFTKNPDAFVTRTRGLATINDDVTSGDFAAAFAQDVARTLGMFNVAGDQNWDRNIPGRPIFDPLSSVFMGVGLILAVRRWHKPAYALLLLWLSLMVAPGFVIAREAPNFLHFTGLIPAVFVLPALGAEWLWNLWERVSPRGWTHAPFIVLFGAYAIGALATYRDYFGTWARSPEVAYLFDSDRWLTLDIARHAAPTVPGLVLVGAGDPGDPLDRFALEGQPEAPRILVFDGSRSLPIPPAATTATYLFSSRDQPPSDLLGPSHGFTPAIVVGSTPAGGPVNSRNLEATRPPLDPSHPVPARFGDSLEVTGFDIPPDVRSGDVVRIRWYWRILHPDPRPLTFFNQLFDEAGAKRGQLDDRPFAPGYWPPGTTGVSWFDLQVDPDAQTGPLTLLVGVYDPATMDRLQITDSQGRTTGYQISLGPIKVHGRPVSPPRVDVPRLTHFADQIDLVGYGFNRGAGGDMTLILDWRARGRSTRDYTVFVHLVGDDGKVWAQADSPPRNGNYPTSLWDAGEVVEDTHRLAFPRGGLPPTYHFAVGLYAPVTGQRLAIVDGEGNSHGDTVDLEVPNATPSGP